MARASWHVASRKRRLWPVLTAVLCAATALACIDVPEPGPVPANKPASYPAWWFTRGVIERTNPGNPNPVWPQDYPASDDFATLTAGQLKNLTTQAYLELLEKFPNQPWDTPGTPANALQELVFSWHDVTVFPAPPLPTGTAHHVVNQGTLKQCAKRVYDVLATLNYTAGQGLPPSGWTSGPYPWTAAPTAPSHYSAANLGMAKHLFSIDLEGFDTDTDGLPDWWENQYWPGDLNGTDHGVDDDADLDGLTNLQELQRGTNPTNTDTDYDGRSDSQEIGDGTNPNDPASAERLLLSKWRFETAELRGEGWQSPKTSENNQLADAWRGKGLDTSANTNSLLVYKDVEADGRPNINLREGSIRFWIKPAWNSGTGPGDSARLIEVGNYSSGNTTGWWALHFNGNGTQISLATQDAANHGTVNLTSGNLTWTAGQWHQVAVTYSPTETRLYIDGSPSGSAGSGITYLPPAAVRAEGFSIGTDLSHTQRADALIDEVECFNYVLGAEQIEEDYEVAVALGVDLNTNGLPDAWEMDKFGNLDQPADGDPDNDGLSNLDEFERGLNPNNNDTDWDGVSDLQELADGTEPDEFASVTPRRIAHFTFDAPDFNLPGGEEPREEEDVEQVDGWRGYGARFDEVTAKLAYERSRQSGAPNIALLKGSVRFWFKPEWPTQPTQMSGYQSRLIQLGTTGNTTLAHWSLYLSQSEPKIHFSEGNGDNAAGISTDGPVAWDAHDWVQITITYTPTTKKLYLNGQQIGSTYTHTSWTFDPDLADLDATGLLFGSEGSQPVKGIIDEVEFFNYELNPTEEIEEDYADEIAAHIDSDDNGLFDAWEIEHFGSIGQDPEGNEDDDGLTNAQESLFGTNPRLATGGADTDGDGRNDGLEVTQGTNPLVPDSAPGTLGQPPTDVLVNTLEPGHHEVTWTNNGPTAIFNTIERTGDGRTWKTVGVVGGTDTSYTDETAEPDLPYFYRVGAVR